MDHSVVFLKGIENTYQFLYNLVMSKNTHHVVPAPSGGWSVKKGGSDRASKHFDHKQDAVDWAREVSVHQNTELVIHRRDGTIQSKDSHGKDPMPPKDHR